MILRVTKGPQRSQRSRNQSYRTRYNLFLVPPAQCPHKKQENLTSFLQSEPTLPQALVDPAVSRGQDGQAGRERFRGGQAVRNSCGIQALCPEDAKHVKLASVERAEVLRGVVMSRCQSIRRVLVGG